MAEDTPPDTEDWPTIVIMVRKNDEYYQAQGEHLILLSEIARMLYDSMEQRANAPTGFPEENWYR